MAVDRQVIFSLTCIFTLLILCVFVNFCLFMDWLTSTYEVPTKRLDLVFPARIIGRMCAPLANRFFDFLDGIAKWFAEPLG